jgi:HSP20 family protein
MYTSLLSAPGGLFAEFDRLQRELQQAFATPSSIRAVARGSFPAVNIGSTPNSIEVYAFAPGIDPATLEVNVDRGVLSIAGERKPQSAAGATPAGSQQGAQQGSQDGPQQASQEGSGQGTVQTSQQASPARQDVNVYVRERFTGSFRRAVSLPEDADLSRVEATYRDGVLRISVARREAAQAKRITVQ